jgi:hypothetical protein
MMELQWIDGIKIILRSKQTHAMVRAIPPFARSALIENIVGYVFDMKEADIE